MADSTETAPVATPETAAPAAVPETVTAAPVDTAAAETPAAEPAPAAAEPAPESAEAPAAPASEPTLLELAAQPKAEDAPAVDKPADKPATEAKPEGEKPTDAAAKPEDKPVEAVVDKPAAPEPVEYKYTLPETLTLPDEMKAEVHTAFDQFRADPTNPQPLIDFHEKAMQAHAERMRQEQWDVFNNTRKEWRAAVQADPEIGGAGHHTAMQAIARVRDRFASSHKPGTKEYEADLAGFDGMLRATGVGDHPEFLRFMHRFAQFAGEPGIGPTDIKPAPQGRGKARSPLYDNTNFPGRTN